LKTLLLVGIALILLSVSIASFSGFVCGTAQHMVTQIEKVVASLTVNTSDLGSIEEGETKVYCKDTVLGLGNALEVATTEDNVYLDFTSDLYSLDNYYNTYNITVKYAAVGSNSNHKVGDTANTVTLESPAIVVTLDKAGVWSFDLEITTTAKSVNSDQTTTVTILVTAETPAG
jgi:hypothetical protein